VLTIANISKLLLKKGLCYISNIMTSDKLLCIIDIYGNVW